LLSSAANYQKIKLLKQRKANHIRSSSIKPDTHFEETVKGHGSSAFKPIPNDINI